MKNRGGNFFHLAMILFLLTGFFVLPEKILASEEELIITEILPNPSGSEKENEFVELHNPTNNPIDLTGWYFYENPNKFILSGNIGAGEYKVFHKTVTLYNKKSTLSLFDSNSKLINEITYPDPKKEDFSYSLICSYWIWVSPSTPREENPNCSGKEEESVPDKNNFSDKIRLNEILPNPSGKELEDEYIELYNYSDEDIDLENWEIKDAKNEKYVFPKNAIIKKNKFFVVFRKDFKFAINNSNENISLLDPDGKEISSVSCGNKNFGSDISYSLDGINWKRSGYMTPGKENKFDEKPKFSIKKDSKVYKNIYANFEIKTDKNQKVTWNFGDGHKSYLQKTRHKYLKTGVFNASVTIRRKEGNVVENFIVEVGKFGESKIEIISVNANPKGKDAKFESITIKNNSKKKINLKNWSIATGWKKLSNHPIKKKLVLKPGETKEITKKYAAFTLNNKQTKIELRYPDGSTASKVKYSKKDGIKDDEVYEKNKKKWNWAEKDNDNVNENIKKTKKEIIDKKPAPVILEETTQDSPEEENYQEKVQKDEPEQIEEEILGAETVKNIETNNKNISGNFFQRIFWDINSFLNKLIILFFK